VAIALVSVAGLLAVGGVEVAHAGRSRHRRGAGAVGESLGSEQASSARHHGPDRDKRQAANVSPLKTKTVGRLLAARDGHISAAVENLDTGQEWLLNRGDRDQTASIVKADILETLLHQRGRTSAGLDSVENATAQGMIEESDNDDATDLWDEVGESQGVAAYNKLAGLKDTSTNAYGYWGETLTTAADQITLLQQLAFPNNLLTTADRNYQLYLMRHVAGYEDWGVNGGVPSKVSVALKNGWVPLDSDGDASPSDDDGGWEINSIGWVKGDGRDYLIAVLTADDPSEQYGIDSIESLSGDVYRSLKPAKHAKAA
jgi:beta-lactamase class A